MMELRGRTALVTGASRGIGRALARALAREGATLVLTARTVGDLERTATLCDEDGAEGTEVRALDLGDGRTIDDLCAELLAEHGAVDVLVNNAGTLVQGHALDGDPDVWEQALRLNVAAPMRLTRRLAPAMKERERGTIINLGSVAAIEGMTNAGAYAATKHALRGWSLSSYQQLRDAGIKVVLLNPAFVDTAMTAHVTGADRSRMLSVDDIAEAAMLAIRTSPACCPEEITLRLTKRPLG
ncbi:MAG: SDR family NAD(P)-dependent oxidoreductase [Sandaracinaceae bacterium]